MGGGLAMQAVYCWESDALEPVDEFISALRDPTRQAALDNQIERFNMLRPNDPPLPFPWSKDTGKVPEAELRVARERWDDFKARMDAEAASAAASRRP